LILELEQRQKIKIESLGENKTTTNQQKQQQNGIKNVRSLSQTSIADEFLTDDTNQNKNHIETNNHKKFRIETNEILNNKNINWSIQDRKNDDRSIINSDDIIKDIQSL
jgi:hypothetical protein